MAKKPQTIIKHNFWNQEVDFSLAVLTIIIFGSALSYVVILAIK